MTVADEALRWLKRGAFPIPVEHRGKVPIGEGWQNQRLTAADVPQIFNGSPRNIGVLWGEPSGNLVDVDLDWPEAATIAAAILPRTAVYDRPGSPNSHLIFRVTGAKTRRWELPPVLLPEGYRGTVLELRADGTQSVVPPSTHPSGEAYRWRSETKPLELAHEVLVQRLNVIAAGGLLCRHWKQGTRHQLALALSGCMLSAGYTAEDVALLITAIAKAIGDPETEDRARAVQSTAEAIRAGKAVTGVPRLAELIGEPATTVLKRWLGLASAIPPGFVTGTTSTTWAIEEPRIFAVGPADIAETPMKWLWPNRIARGKLNMIAGEPGLSKSVLTVEIAAITSRGGRWPLDGTSCEPGRVLMLNVEDDPADTIKPRLMAANAALERIRLIGGVQLPDGRQRGMTLADVELLDRYLDEHRSEFVLLVCDPIGALMAGADSHKDSDVRALLAPLASLAMKHELAVLLVAHLNKAVGMTALNRVVGSIGFAAAVRMLYFLVRDPDDRERLLLIPGKANLAPATMAGLSYHLESADLGRSIVAPRIRWHDVPEMRSANEVLNPPKPDRETPARLEAEEWLRTRLAYGPVPVRTLREEAAMAVDGSWRSIQRAAGRVGVVGAGEHKDRTWQLPREALRHDDITTTHHESSSCPDASVAKEQGDTVRQTLGSWRDAALAQCHDAAEDRPLEPEPSGQKDNAPSRHESIRPGAEPQQQTLEVGDVLGPELHPCIACAKLELTGFCNHYGRTIAEPARPNACIHWEQRPPDLPWESA